MSHRPEVITCVVLAVILAAVSGWSAWRHARSRPVPAAAVQLRSAGAPRLAEIAPVSEPAVWPAPVSQARGRDWVFALFAPPEILFLAGSWQFKVATRGAVNGVAPTAVETVPKLLTVRTRDFPLQLTGHLGEGDNTWGIFENWISGETLLLKTGGRVPGLGLEIAHLRVHRLTIAMPKSMAAHAIRANATVHGADGSVHVLQEGEVAAGIGLVAVVSAQGRIFEIGEGEVLALGPNRFRFDRIRSTPASVDVTKESPGDEAPESLVLIPPPDRLQQDIPLP